MDNITSIRFKGNLPTIPRDDGAVDPISIANEVLRGVIPRKCLCYLARNSFCRRVCCDVDLDEVSAVQAHNDEGIEQVESDGRGNEQVQRGNVWSVVTQKGAPSLTWCTAHPR